MANVGILSQCIVSDQWVWDLESLPAWISFSYLGLQFSSDGSWDKDITSLIICNKQKLAKMYNKSKIDGLYRVFKIIFLASHLSTGWHIHMALL